MNTNDNGQVSAQIDTKQVLGAGHDPMPTEADFETMGCASNGEYFEMTDWHSYRLALAEWKKRNGVE